MRMKRLPKKIKYILLSVVAALLIVVIIVTAYYPSIVPPYPVLADKELEELDTYTIYDYNLSFSKVERFLGKRIEPGFLTLSNELSFSYYTIKETDHHEYVAVDFGEFATFVGSTYHLYVMVSPTAQNPIMDWTVKSIEICDHRLNISRAWNDVVNRKDGKKYSLYRYLKKLEKNYDKDYGIEASVVMTDGGAVNQIVSTIRSNYNAEVTENNSYLDDLYKEASQSGHCHQIKISFEENSSIVWYAEYFVDNQSNKTYLVVKRNDAGNMVQIYFEIDLDRNINVEI